MNWRLIAFFAAVSFGPLQPADFSATPTFGTLEAPAFDRSRLELRFDLEGGKLRQRSFLAGVAGSPLLIPAGSAALPADAVSGVDMELQELARALREEAIGGVSGSLRWPTK